MYEQTIETIFGLGDTEVELEDDASDQEIYSTVINSLRLTDQDLDFINFDLTNKNIHQESQPITITILMF